MTTTTLPTLPLRGAGSIPLLGLGTWKLSGDEAYTTVRTALDLGYRHLDTATMYGNEADIGRALRDSDVAREDVFVTTKLPAERAGHERETLEASLRALGVDAVDLWLIHWPPGGTASAPTWQALLDLQQEGKATAVGVSNYDTAQIDELVRATGQAPAVNQVRWSPANHDPRLLADSRERGVVLEGYSPFRAGSLDDPVLQDVAAQVGVTAARVVLRWHLQHEVVVIPKSASAERLASNLDILKFTLSDEHMGRIDALGR